MRYLWCCQTCGKIEEVERPLKDIEVPPDPCPLCDEDNWRRGISQVYFCGPKNKGHFNNVKKIPKL